MYSVVKESEKNSKQKRWKKEGLKTKKYFILEGVFDKDFFPEKILLALVKSSQI